MKKLLFFGDSITDACRARESQTPPQYGTGYVIQILGKLSEKNPVKYEVINEGISGNRIVAYDLEEALNMERIVDQEMYDLAEVLAK